ncbi:MAG: glycoside hydrolase family 16 protein [Verrucomicrobia bacterium]|nr:MAG: glycoside hydrolase family 16 protein [Verrucomicrobiota bacterium]
MSEIVNLRLNPMTCRSIQSHWFLALLGMCVVFFNLHAQDIDPSSGNVQPIAGSGIVDHKLAWSDEFNGTALDTAKWNYRLDNRYWSVQKAANVAVGNGQLQLLLKKEVTGTFNYSAGGVISKRLMRYGYYEARMKVPPGAGWHTSFWMMKANRPATDTVAIELDAIENDSVTPLKYGVNLHRHLPAPHVTFGSKSVTTASLSANYHVFGCEFTPTVVRYFYDGALVQSIDARQFPHNDVNVWLTSIASFDYVRFFEPRATASVNIISPHAAGVTLTSVSDTLRVAAEVSSSDPNFTPTVQWSKFSGPGDVTFDQPDSANTWARFSQRGSYLLQCLASVDGTNTMAFVPVAIDAPLVATFRQSFDAYQHVATFIRGDSVDWNSGGRDHLIVGRWNQQPMRGLLSFDLSALASDATIEDVSLDLWTDVTKGTGSVGALTLHQLTNTPMEGSGDGRSASNGAGTGATWKSRTGGSLTTDLWGINGGDYASPTISSVAGFDASVSGRVLHFSSTSAWINQVRTAHQSQRPLNLLVRSPSTEAGNINAISRISSDDSADVEQRPMLTVSYRGHSAPSLALSSPELLMTAFSQQTVTATTSNANVLRWQQMAGPAELVITSPADASTGIQAPAPGIYTIALTAQNALAETRMTATLDVMSAMEAWRLQCFSRRDNTSTAANLADPDGDGMVNLLEYATGNSPLSTSPAIGAVQRVDTALVFEHTRLAASADPSLVYHVEWSGDLLSWHTDGVTNAAQESSDGDKTIRWRSSIPIETGAKFFRLRVSAP